MSDRIVGDVFDQLTAFREENIALKAENARLTRELDGADALGERTEAERDELLALAREMLPELQEYTDSIGGCDHAVGICACRLKRLVEDARATLSRLDGPVTP